MIYAITNQKGGVGKTTTAAALWHGLGQRGRHVLAIDLDAQGNLSYSARAKQGRGIPSIMGVLMGEADIDSAIQQTSSGDIIPSTPGLNAADSIFSQTGRAFLLRNILRELGDRYDDVVIDTPPALGIMTVNALVAAEAVIIPASCEVYSIQAIQQVAKAVSTLHPDFNPLVRVTGILLTKYNGRNTITREAERLIEEQAHNLHTIIYKSRIREGVAVKEAQIVRQPLASYAPKSKPAQDYKDFIDEIEKQRESFTNEQV